MFCVRFAITRDSRPVRRTGRTRRPTLRYKPYRMIVADTRVHAMMYAHINGMQPLDSTPRHVYTQPNATLQPSDRTTATLIMLSSTLYVAKSVVVGDAICRGEPSG